MLDQFSRTQLLLGTKAMKRLEHSRVAIFGIGGVGGFAVEGLARSGIGSFDLFDNDTICQTNINRQIIATTRTIGNYKVDVMKERILEINPKAVVLTHRCFYTPEVADNYDLSQYTYIIDAIDTVTSKLELILRANKEQVPIISCMGAGNKLDPTKFEVTDIYKTSMCPLAKVMRKELKARGVQQLKVVYSTEPAKKLTEEVIMEYESNATGVNQDVESKQNRKKQVPGSISFVPSVAGFILAGEVIKDISELL